jgi:hypothetical protein
MGAERLVLNGIDGACGDHLLPPMTAEEVSAMARRETLKPAQLLKLSRRYPQAMKPSSESRQSLSTTAVVRAGIL